MTSPDRPSSPLPQGSDRARDERLHAPATQRNKAPIAAVLARWLPAEGTVLELASGTGEHAVHFAAAFPRLTWLPSDPAAAHRRSIDAHRRAAGLGNLLAPRDIDVTSAVWPLPAPVAAMLCCNMIHIAPWVAAEGLFAGAARHLKAAGGLCLYGPFKRDGRHTAPSNEVFDASLRAQDPEWGVRDLADVAALAAGHGFAAPLVETLPANNLALWFAKP